MVGYVHDSTTHWMIWDRAFRAVRSQSDVIIDEQSNAHTCLHRDQREIFEVPEEMEYVEEFETGGDGLLHDHAGTSRTGEGHKSGNHDCTENDTDPILPDADNGQRAPASTGVRSCPPDEEDAQPVSRETVVHNRHLRRQHDKPRRTAAMTKQSCLPQPPLMNHVTRSQVKISTNALIVMAKALTSTSINSDPFTYAETIDSPQRDHWKRAMDEECTLILLNNTFTTINSREAWQL